MREVPRRIRYEYETTILGQRIQADLFAEETIPGSNYFQCRAFLKENKFHGLPGTRVYFECADPQMFLEKTIVTLWIERKFDELLEVVDWAEER